MHRRSPTVEDVMTTALTTVHPDQLIESAELEMKLANVRHIPVVGAHNQLVGILSNRDLLLEYKIGCVPVLGDEDQLVGIVTETDFLRIARESLRD